MYMYNITTTSQIHATGANSEGGSGKDVNVMVTSSVSGGVEAPFQVVETTHPT
jgi:hypothetical protein